MMSSEFLVSSATILSGGSPVTPLLDEEADDDGSIESGVSASGSLFSARCRLCRSFPAPTPPRSPAAPPWSISGIAPAAPAGLAEPPEKPACFDRGETLRVGCLTTFISFANIDCSTPASSATGRFCT